MFQRKEKPKICNISHELTFFIKYRHAITLKQISLVATAKLDCAAFDEPSFSLYFPATKTNMACLYAKFAVHNLSKTDSE